MAVCVCSGQLEDNLAVSDFPPGDHNLTLTVTDVYGQAVSEVINFARPELLEVACIVDATMDIIDCASTQLVESQTCSFDDGVQFDCSLPLIITELAERNNLEAGMHAITIRQTDEFGQQAVIVVNFNVTRELFTNAVWYFVM